VEGTPTPQAPAEETPARSYSSSPSSGPFPFAAAFGGDTDEPVVTDAEPPAGGSAADEAASKPGGEPPAAGDAGTPAPSEPSTPASPPEAPSEQEAEPSRRQSARERDEAEKADLKRLVDEAIAERDRARAEADKATADKAQLEARSTQAIARREELRGPDAEYERRTRISNRTNDPYYEGPHLTADEASELARWTLTRELEEPFTEAANQSAATWVDQQIKGQRTQWATEALTVADEIGLSKDVLANPDNASLGRLLKATASAVEARVRENEVAPLTDKVSQQDARIKELETSLVHSQRTPVIGGRSDSTLPRADGAGWDPTLPWSSNLGRAPAATNGSH
jgi:hypothetical protein